MAMYRKENLWTTPSKRPIDHFAKSTVRGLSNIGGRSGYSRAKVEEASSSNIISNKKVAAKDEIPKEDPAQRVNILNDKQNSSQFGYHHVPINDKLKEIEERGKEQRRQDLERAKLMEKMEQSKQEFK